MTRAKCASARLESLRRGRTLTLVDIENLVGKPRPTAASVAEVCAALGALDIAAAGVTVVAASRPGALSTRLRLAVHEVLFLNSPPTSDAPGAVAA
jgi:hypothetical protein